MIDDRIARDLPEQLQLGRFGFQVVGSEYEAESFGNWFVRFSGKENLTISRDRGQYIVDGDHESLEAAGLWKGFGDRVECATLLLAYATR